MKRDPYTRDLFTDTLPVSERYPLPENMAKELCEGIWERLEKVNRHAVDGDEKFKEIEKKGVGGYRNRQGYGKRQHDLAICNSARNTLAKSIINYYKTACTSLTQEDAWQVYELLRQQRGIMDAVRYTRGRENAVTLPTPKQVLYEQSKENERA